MGSEWVQYSWISRLEAGLECGVDEFQIVVFVFVSEIIDEERSV